jgi:hypothetical protein
MTQYFSFVVLGTALAAAGSSAAKQLYRAHTPRPRENIYYPAQTPGLPVTTVVTYHCRLGSSQPHSGRVWNGRSNHKLHTVFCNDSRPLLHQLLARSPCLPVPISQAFSTHSINPTVQINGSRLQCSTPFLSLKLESDPRLFGRFSYRVIDARCSLHSCGFARNEAL